MKILITGGAGFIGSHLCDRLIEKGLEVRIFDNLEPQVHGSNPQPYRNPKAEFVLGDIRNKDQLSQALENIDCVFHMAAATGVGQSMYQISKYFEVNVQGTANLLDILANRPQKVSQIILASSRAVYGEGAYQCGHCGIVFPETRSMEQLKNKQWEVQCPQCGRNLLPIVTSEQKPLHPGSMYAVTKVTQEMMVTNFSQAYGLPATILRFFNVYGPRQSIQNPYTGIITAFIQCLVSRKAPEVYENGLMTRDFIYVGDVVKACVLAMEKGAANQKIVNIGTGHPTSILELANLLCQLFDPNIHPQIVEKARFGDIAHCTDDLTLARELLGFEPSVSLTDGLRATINDQRILNPNLSSLTDQAERELRAAGLLISK